MKMEQSKRIPVVEMMLTGEMDMKEFQYLLDTDEKLHEEILAIFSDEMKKDSSHPIWKRYDYQNAKENSFDLTKVIRNYPKSNLTIGNELNIFGAIKACYSFVHPDIKCTTKYRDTYGLYLDIAGEYFEGSEVAHFIEKIISDCIHISPKTTRIKEAKKQIAEMFHVTDRKRPYWIQGAEWPAGKNSPMQFWGSERIYDGKKYIFTDVDTGEMREIIQHY